MDSEHNELADVISYNIYYGWYVGSLDENEEFMDTFHEKNPDIPLGISEYGVEGIINWHTDDPKNQDYTEEYHALYHEHMAEVLDKREYIWSSHVWNMFDFGADNRDEGGISGRNNKGLVTFDRRTKKDAFYIYKAYWSNDPFVHITGKRYAQRPYNEMTLKVYSNLDELTLYVNGKEYETKTGDKVFKFQNVPLDNQYTTLTVSSKQDASDSVTFEKVNQPNPYYVLPEEEEEAQEGVRNWFEETTDEKQTAPEMTFNENYFSVRDKVKDILANEEAEKILLDTISSSVNMNIKPTTLAMLNEAPVTRIGNFIGTDADSDLMKWLNAGLQEVKK
jgi:beta-galactosidase